MARVTAQEFAEKHNRRTKAAIPDMQKGIERVTVAPSGQAIAKQGKMLQNITAAVQDGRWAKGLQKITLQDWKDKMINKGLNRVGSGLDASLPKVEAFATKFLPAVDAAVAKVKGMSDLSLSDSIARMTSFVTDMSKFKK